MLYYPIDNNIKLKLFEKHHGEEFYYLIEENRLHLEQWLNFVKTLQSIQDCERFIVKTLNKFSQGFQVHMGIWLDEILIGAICIINIDDNCKKAELGYFLAKKYEGKGYITRALQIVISHLLNERRLNRLEINCSSKNYKSINIAKRLGFKHEGTLEKAELYNDQYCDLVIFGFVKPVLQL